MIFSLIITWKSYGDILGDFSNSMQLPGYIDFSKRSLVQTDPFDQKKNKDDLENRSPSEILGHYFKSGTFDIIFNPATMQYLSDKIQFIEEAHRILTKEGIAALELEQYRPTHPVEYQNNIEIWDKEGKRIDVLNYLKKFKNIQVKKSKNRPWHYILMKKVKNFNLGLKLIKYINLEEIAPSPVFWGSKSIYRIL